MKTVNITEKQSQEYNSIISHPLQAFEWGKFREKTGVKVIRKGFIQKGHLVSGFQMTIHKIPYLPWNIGYLPKGDWPDQNLLSELVQTGKENNCVYIQIEPNRIIQNSEFRIQNLIHNSGLIILNSFRSLFTKYTFILDLAKSKEELLAAMHPKTRYNIKVAQKHNVQIIEDNSDQAFAKYLELTNQTTQRQKFFAHNKEYHQKMWESLKTEGGIQDKNKLSAHLFLAKYSPEQKTKDKEQDKILACWIVFVFGDTLYYPYGASSNEYRNLMASNLMMWEVIKFGKRLGLKKFDMWGALGPNPWEKDPWYGFHRFKQGFGPNLVEFVGSYDLVINPFVYKVVKILDKIRWMMLKIKTVL